MTSPKCAIIRWVYRRILVADGNFKADHVMKAGSANEHWLLDGAGMMANRQEYLNFVKTAIERQTVRYSFGLVP